MSRLKQKLALKNIGKYRTEKEALVNANYSPSYAKSGLIKRTKTFKDLMEKYLPDTTLAKVHGEGLKAEKKQFRNNVTTGEIEEVAIEPDHANRHKYLDSAYKLKGKYAAEELKVTIPRPPFDYVRSRNNNGNGKDTKNDEEDTDSSGGNIGEQDV